MFSANELWGNTTAKCPYCSANQSMDQFKSEAEQVNEYQCEKCDKYFLVQTRVEIRYDSVGSCKLNGQIHTLKKGFYKSFNCINCQAEFYDWQLPGGEHPILKEDECVFVDETKCGGVG